MKYLELNNGDKMPMLGLGLWQAENPKELETAIEKALDLGYRHFDTAWLYGNEDVLGASLKRWLDSKKGKREDLFITTKLPMIGNSADKVEHFLNLSLKALQLQYVDLYLIHGPIGFQYVDDNSPFPKDSQGKILLDMKTDLVGLWKAMEKQVDAGKAKNIGISNFTIEQMERIVKSSRIKPANNQVELNAYFQQEDLVKACKKHGVTIVAYAPLGSPGRKLYFEKRGITYTCPPILEDPTVLDLAKKYKKTTAQILLRHLIQLGIATIPKSTNQERLANNIDIFDFELTESDMQLLKGLDKGKAGRSFKMDTFPGVENHPEFSLD